MDLFQRPDYQKGPSARVEVERMHGYQAPLEGRRSLLRLDFNENTIGPSPLVVEALNKIPASHIAIYPEYNELRKVVLETLKNIFGFDYYLFFYILVHKI